MAGDPQLIEYKCRKCGCVVVKRQGNLLFSAGSVMSLFHGGLVFPCPCGESLYFDVRSIQLPTKRQVRGDNDDGAKMLYAA